MRRISSPSNSSSSGENSEPTRQNTEIPKIVTADCTQTIFFECPILENPELLTPKERKNSEGSSGILENCQIDFDEIVMGEQIGAGSYGVVKKGKWREVDVAIKMLHEVGQVDQFFREAELLCKLRHPNIVNCLGVCVEPNQCIVMEFLPNNLFAEIQKGPMQLRRILTIATGVAIGLNFLHQSKPQILHRDLKPGNILLDASYTPRIADFGISREKLSQGTMSMTRIGTPVYTAPEIHNNKRYNHKVDIYSFGMVMYAMTFGSSPWKNLKLSNFQICVRLAIKNERPQFLPGTNNRIIKIIQRCWSASPSHRPNACEVIQMLRECQKPVEVLDLGTEDEIQEVRKERPHRSDQVISIEETPSDASSDSDFPIILEASSGSTDVDLKSSVQITKQESEPALRRLKRKSDSNLTNSTIKKRPQQKSSVVIDMTGV